MINLIGLALIRKFFIVFLFLMPFSNAVAEDLNNDILSKLKAIKTNHQKANFLRNEAKKVISMEGIIEEQKLNILNSIIDEGFKYQSNFFNYSSIFVNYLKKMEEYDLILHYGKRVLEDPQNYKTGGSGTSTLVNEYKRRGEHKKAIAVYDCGLLVAPQFSTYLLGAKARYYKRILKDYDNALIWYKKAINYLLTKDPNAQDLVQRLEIAKLNSDNPNKRYFAGIFKITNRAKISSYYREIAKVYEKLNDKKNFIESLEQSLLFEPESYLSYVALADAYIKEDKHEIAKKYMEQCFNNINLKRIRHGLIPVLERWIKIRPLDRTTADNIISDFQKLNSEYDGHYVKAKYLEMTKSYRLAKEEITKCLPYAVKNYHKRQIYKLRARCAIKTYDYGLAIHDLERKIEIDPSDHENYNMASWILSTCQDSKFRNGNKALIYAKKAVELNPDAYTYDTIAAAYAEIGDFKNAVEGQIKSINLLKNQKYLNEFKSRLALYKKNTPYRSQ